MPRVLVIAYHFPPSGTGGVGRALGWVRHLPACGWDTTVLASPPPPNWPLDPTLEAQIPPGTEVRRVAARDPRPPRWRGIERRELSFFWRSAALSAGARLLAGRHHDVILATAPPPVAHHIASVLSRRFDVPWVADFRDPWGVCAPAWWRRWRRKIYLDTAAGVVAVNDTLAEHLRAGAARQVATIFNGFEPDEIPHDVPRIARRVVFLGTISEFNLLDGFFGALARAGGEFVHIGAERHYDLGSRARRAGLLRVQSTGYLPRARALALAASGSVFVVSLRPDLELAVSAKTFDYIGLGGPILCLGKGGAMADFVGSRPHIGTVVDAQDGLAIERALNELFANPRQIAPEERAIFARSAQARELAAVLSAAAKKCVS
jgi:glycosyltransferase involved in cell wall biosynthesis